jgi:hypothetical protein
MSRPYLNINSMTYSAGVLSMNYSYYKLRSATPASRTLTITGFSSSISFVQTHDNVDYSSGRNSDYITFSVGSLGTSSTTSYTPASTVITFGGTPSTTSNVVFTLNSLPLGSVTSSVSTLSTYLSSIASGLAFSATNSGFVATATGTTLTFTAPVTTGTVNNSLALTMVATRGAGGSTLTWSSVAVFAGGVNTHTPLLTYTTIGGGEDTQRISTLSITGSAL